MLKKPKNQPGLKLKSVTCYNGGRKKFCMGNMTKKPKTYDLMTECIACIEYTKYIGYIGDILDILDIVYTQETYLL